MSFSSSTHASLIGSINLSILNAWMLGCLILLVFPYIIHAYFFYRKIRKFIPFKQVNTSTDFGPEIQYIHGSPVADYPCQH